MLSFFINQSTDRTGRSFVSECRLENGPGSEVIKKFFMLNSAKHDFFHANQSQITNNAIFFS